MSEPISHPPAAAAPAAPVGGGAGAGLPGRSASATARRPPSSRRRSCSSSIRPRPSRAPSVRRPLLADRLRVVLAGSASSSVPLEHGARLVAHRPAAARDAADDGRRLRLRDGRPDRPDRPRTGLHPDLLFIASAIVHADADGGGRTKDSDAGFEGTLRALAYSTVSQLGSVVPFAGGLIAWSGRSCSRRSASRTSIAPPTARRWRPCCCPC